MAKYLIVVAHPDDEVLGVGGTIRRLSDKGSEIDTCILISEAQARSFRPEDRELEENRKSSEQILGVHRRFDGTFPDAETNTVPHIRLVQFIEKVILDSKPDVILTHHPADTHYDHRQVSIACMQAFRIFQRRDEIKPVTEFGYFEVPSSTDWSLDSTLMPFRPNKWVEIGKTGLEAKLKALEQYKGVMRPYPHPRSPECIEGLAAYRGSQAAFEYAEAFEVVFSRNAL